MNISEKTLEQLKALAYDQVVLMEQSRANLQVLNTEMAKREKNAEMAKRTEKEPTDDN